MTNRQTIFIVDDNDVNLVVARESLKNDYNVMTMASASKMFILLEKIKPNLILLDIEMPEVTGFEALKHLKENPLYAHIPVIFITGLKDPALEEKGFDVGAVDFVMKPFSPKVLRHRVKIQLDLEGIIRERTTQLEQINTKLGKLQDSIIFTLSDMVEGRDHSTGGHVDRTAEYIRILLEELILDPKYTAEIEKHGIHSLVSSSRLHDVGKFSVSDTILNKPGKLTPEEFKIMENHVIEGDRIIRQISTRAEGVAFLENARIFAISHHEKWDGSGYPSGLKGDDIPIQGRIMAIVDVYDALTSERPYKKAFSPEIAISIITESSGTHFDPSLVDVFNRATDKFKEATIRLHEDFNNGQTLE